MRDALEWWLSFLAAPTISAVLSVTVVWLLCSKFPTRPYSLWIVAVPFAVAYGLYWWPVWFGAEPSEFGAWAFLGVGMLFFAGFLPSAILALILRKRRQRRESFS
jgi:hypothetical protein